MEGEHFGLNVDTVCGRSKTFVPRNYISTTTVLIYIQVVSLSADFWFQILGSE